MGFGKISLNKSFLEKALVEKNNYLERRKQTLRTQSPGIQVDKNQIFT